MQGVEGDGAARLAESEARFRRINEAIERGERPEGRPAGYLCECGELGCTDVVDLSHEQYEAVRTSFDRFLVAPGHLTPVDEVVEDHGRYLVVAKSDGTARRVVLEDDPRGSR